MSPSASAVPSYVPQPGKLKTMFLNLLLQGFRLPSKHSQWLPCCETRRWTCLGSSDLWIPGSPDYPELSGLAQSGHVNPSSWRDFLSRVSKMRQTREEEWIKAWEGFTLPLLALEMRKMPWANNGSSLWMLEKTREQFQARVRQGTWPSQHLDFNPVRLTVFHSSYIHVDFCSCQSSRNATHTNPTMFISLLDMCTFYQHIPPSATDERGRTERNKLPSFSFFFYVIRFQYKLLAFTGK